MPTEVLELDMISDRRTDDLLFNVRYLAQYATLGQVELDEVDEQNISDIAESDIHNLGVRVEQRLCADGEYRRMGETDVERTTKGRDAVDISDQRNQGEYVIRNQDVILAQRLTTPEVRREMRRGAMSIYVTPPPTERDMDVDVAIDFNYDGRTMVRFESISADGNTKYMDSFSVFDVPIQAWQQLIAEKFQVYIEPTALAVMKFFSEQLPLQHISLDEALIQFVGGVAKYTDEDVQAKLHVQLHDFLYKQEELREKAKHYANEKRDLQQELSRSLGRVATPTLIKRLKSVKNEIKPAARAYLDSMWTRTGLEVDDTVAKILVSTHNININNRAGLAAGNLRTILKIRSKIGEELTKSMIKTELQIIHNTANGLEVDFMTRRNEQLVAESGVGCGGNCSVSIVDMYSEEGQAARSAGLTGTLYKSAELNRTSKCSCIAKKQQPNVVVNGKDVVCTNCGEFKVNGKWGSLTEKQDAPKDNVISLAERRVVKAPAVKQELVAA